MLRNMSPSFAINSHPNGTPRNMKQVCKMGINKALLLWLKPPVRFRFWGKPARCLLHRPARLFIA